MKSRYNALKLKQRAMEFRSQGCTFGEIQKKIGCRIPKSTLSYWSRNIKLGDEQKQKIIDMSLINIGKAREKALAANKIKRDIFLKSLYDRNKYLESLVRDKNIAKIVLAVLYLGEGAKWRSNRYLGLGNSNPEVIKFYLTLLKNCFNIDEEKLKCRIGYRADQDINELQNFWSGITGIPIANFYMTKFDSRTIGKITKNKEYRGVCVVYYCDTKIQLELEIIADLIMKGPVV